MHNIEIRLEADTMEEMLKKLKNAIEAMENNLPKAAEALAKEEDSCKGCECKEECETTEELETMIEGYRSAIVVILRELELLPQSIVDSYNDLLLELQPYVEDEDSADCEDS